MLPNMTNIHLVDNDAQALTTLKQLINSASDLTYKKDRGNMQIQNENKKKRGVAKKRGKEKK